MIQPLDLFCLVDGEAPANAFSVKIPSTDTVSDLKKLIKVENSHEYSDVDAKELTLWRVSISPMDVDDKFPICLDSLTEKTELRPLSRLSVVFTEQPPEETIHIIVQRPSP
ncbi:hypothetical protein BGZ75_002264, partial [Mortierella antarctica]